jgi:hypothetical protein
MKDSCGRFYFTNDMNFDGLFTISDFSLIVKQIFLFPANITVFLIEQESHLVKFFEIDCSTGTGWGAVIFSLFVWWFFLTAD